MIIAMIGHKSVPSREGGIEIVVEELSTRMVKNNEVHIFNRKRKDNKGLKEYNGCKLFRIFTINKKSLDAIVYSFFATLKVRRMMKKKKVDVIHFHAEGPCYFLWLLKKRNCKLIVTIHGLDWQRGKWGGFASKIILKGEQNAVKYADDIIVLSKSNQDYFKNKYTRDTIFIPNGVTPVEIKEANLIKEKYSLNKDDYILFLARIVPEKGLHYLIEAWKKINTSKKLVIAGGISHSSDYYDEINKLIDNDSSIIQTGFVTGVELEELYSNAYLYVLPSDVEGMPMSLLEALAYGNTCLVSDIPENKEVIKDTQYTFEKGNIEDLKDKLEELISLNLDTHKEQIQVYKWEDVVDSTLKLYRK